MPQNSISISALPEAAGERLDKWLSTHVDLSRSRLKTLIEKGDVRINNAAETNPSAKVVALAEYTIIIPPLESATPLPEDIALDIYFEDEHLIVVNKPAGMTVHPAPGSPNGTLVNALLFHAKDSLSGIGGVMRPGIVHRIDKDTSGLLVVAKHDKVHHHLSRQFAKHTVDRTYVCFVRGLPKPKEGRIESRLARSPQNRKKQSVVKGSWGNMEVSETGRHAVTNYKFLQGFGQMAKASLGTPLISKVQCRLETGRTHQIRVHMAHMGCPLIGDPLYGKQRAFNTNQSENEVKLRNFMSGFKRQALHAHTLGFTHPISKEHVEFTAPLSDDLLQLEEILHKLQ